MAIRAWAAGSLAAAALAASPPGAQGHGPIGAVGDIACNLSGGTGTTAGSTTCLLRATEVVYVTNWGPEGQAPLRRQLLSVVGVPTPLDVDNRLGADLVATLRLPSAGSVTLDISKLPGASTTLPVAVVAFANDPGDTALRYAFGYDARRSGAPAGFQETFTPRSGALGVAVTTTGAASAALLGRRAVVDRLTGREIERVEARVGFTPLPGTITADVGGGDAGGVATTTARLTVGAPSKVTVDLAQESGGAHSDLDATLDRLAGTATATLQRTAVAGAEPAGTPRTDVSVKITGPRVARAALTLVDTPAGGRATTTDAVLEQLPSSAGLTLAPQTASAPQTITVTPAPGESIGLVDVARAEGGAPRRLTDDQYAHVFGDGSTTSTAARVRGLERATLQLASRPAARERDLVHVDGTSAGGPFRVLVDEPAAGRRLEARIADLPRTVDFTLRPKGTPTIRYVGSADIATATVTLHDDAGVARTTKPSPVPGRPDLVAIAQDLEVVAGDVPTDLTVTLEPDGKGLSLSANDVATGLPDDIGRLDLRLSTGALTGADQAFVDDLTRTGRDGALVRDHLGRYVVVARITSLEQATLALDQEPLHVDLEHGAQYGTAVLPARALRVLVETQEARLAIGGTGALIVVPSTQAIEAEVDALPRDVDLKARREATQTQPSIRYEGSSTVTSATLRIHDDDGIAASQGTGNVAHDLVATLTTLPADVRAWILPQAAGTMRIDVVAPVSPIGRVDVRLFSRPPGGGDTFPVAADEQFVTGLGTKDGALVRDVADGPGGLVDDRYVIFARLASLSDATLELEGQDRLAIDLTHTARAFQAVVEETQKRTQVDIDRLPATVFFAYAPAAVPTLSYDGSDKIDSLVVTRREDDADGIARGDRGKQIARDLRVTVKELPGGSPITANLDPSGKAIDLNATADIGQLEVQLSDGPLTGGDKQFVDDLTTNPFGTVIERDGALVRDLSNRYVVFARVTKLRRARVLLDETSPDVRLESGSSRDLVVSVRQAAKGGGADEGIGVTVEARPPCMRLALSKEAITPVCSSGHGAFSLLGPTQPAPAGALVVLYEGSAPSAGLRVDAEALERIPQRKNLSVALRDVPARLEALLVGERQIGLATKGGKLGSTDVLLTTRPLGAAPDPADVLLPSQDGVLLRNKLKVDPNDPRSFVTDRDLLHAHLTGLRSAHISTRPSVEATVDADPSPAARRRFRFDSRRDAVVPRRPACADRLDNDRDGSADGVDSECASSTDDDETSATVAFQPGFALFEEYATAVIHELQPRTSFKQSDLTGALEIDYSAGAVVPAQASSTGFALPFALLFETNAGVADRLLAGAPDAEATEFVRVMTNALPRSVRFCLRGSGEACGVDPFGLKAQFVQPDGPTIHVDADATFNGDVLKCDDPGINGVCNGSPLDDRYLAFNLNVKEGEFQFTKLPGGKLGVWLDTDLDDLFADTLSGFMDLRLPFEVRGTFPAGFKADDFRLEIAGLSIQQTAGQAFCPSGMSLRAAGIDVMPLIRNAGFC